ncbi:MAG TPA: OFA family MFS transporter [Tepidisphaeraceae bacterium]|jgi:MFS family permease|nr:OFA family MFS transporter [Tepidisphaeraceae bacterium]
MTLLNRRHTLASPGFNRWLVPPAALAVHLSIGQVYAFSVFKLPLTQIIGITHHDPADWTQPSLAWIFSIAILFLGLAAAFLGTWVENAGPRKAMLASACCFSTGFLLSSLGVHTHQLWLLYLGYGVIGGIGLGLGYVAPVSTLIKWFVDRPGMATGLAIMGFGGGAMIGGPLAVRLMSHFSSATSNGVAPTMLVMAAIYFCSILFGAILIRVPADNYAPANYIPKPATRMITTSNIDAATALRTPQFYLLWLVLCLNVTAGIGILEQASPMIQEMFKSRVTPAAAAGFVGLLSLFNMLGRFFWSTLSDYIGRKTTYTLFFTIGLALYLLLPRTGSSSLNSLPLFVLTACLILSMYGGSFATMPAYVRDLFGSRSIGVTYARLLTAWSAAGLLGPLLVNYLRTYQIQSRHLPPAQAYTAVLTIMASLLFLGLLANLLIRPVSQHHFTKEPANALP